MTGIIRRAWLVLAVIWAGCCSWQYRDRFKPEAPKGDWFAENAPKRGIPKGYLENARVGPWTPYQRARAEAILAPLHIPQSLKLQASDAFTESMSQDDLATRLKWLPLADAVRADLWDAYAPKTLSIEEVEALASRPAPINYDALAAKYGGTSTAPEPLKDWLPGALLLAYGPLFAPAILTPVFRYVRTGSPRKPRAKDVT